MQTVVGAMTGFLRRAAEKTEWTLIDVFARDKREMGDEGDGS